MTDDLKVGIVVAAVVIAFFIGVFASVINTSNNNHDTSVACVKAGGSWVDGKKCDNN